MAGKNRRNQKREDKSKDTSIITLPIKKRIIEVPRRERNSLHLINSNGELFCHCQICNREFKDLIYHNCPKNNQKFVVTATQAESGQKKIDFIARREFGENNTKYNSCSEQIETRTSRNPAVCAPSKQMKNNTPRNIWIWAPSKKIKTRDPRACIPSKQLKRYANRYTVYFFLFLDMFIIVSMLLVMGIVCFFYFKNTYIFFW